MLFELQIYISLFVWLVFLYSTLQFAIIRQYTHAHIYIRPNGLSLWREEKKTKLEKKKIVAPNNRAIETPMELIFENVVRLKSFVRRGKGPHLYLVIYRIETMCDAITSNMCSFRFETFTPRNAIKSQMFSIRELNT